jgi:hypothetical protein
VALQQREVQRGLVGEMAVEDRLGDAGGGRHVLESGALVAPLPDEPARGVDDERAALAGRKPSGWVATHVTRE